MRRQTPSTGTPARRAARWLIACVFALVFSGAVWPGASTAYAQSDAEHQQFLFAYRLLQRGDVEEAASEFDDYLGEFPQGEKLGDAQYYRALLYRRAGDNERAAETLDDSADPTLVPGYAVDLLRGQVPSDLGRFEDALASLERIDVEDLEPNVAVSALYLKGLAYRGADNLEAAATALGDAAQLDTPMRARALLDLAKVRAREAMRRPTAAKVNVPSMQSRPKPMMEPRRGTLRAKRAKSTRVVTSMTRNTPRERMKESRKELRRIGVTSRRLRSFFWRVSAMAKPIPQIPVPMRFMPRSPGKSQSI